VVENSTNFTKEEIQELTYKLCLNYYGFAGGIKTPASTMYAKKIAHYAYQTGLYKNNS
jgi:hypothetical protein